MLNKPKLMDWRLGGHPTINFNFLSGVLDPSITFSRASSATYFDNTGTLQTVGNNIPRVSDYNPSTLVLNGWRLDPAATNEALQCRNFTQAAWVAVTMTTALNQTGIDGAANSASLLTASAGNATILQTVTQAAVASQFSVYLKRVSGTGVINITQNGGVTWTPVTLTSNYQRLSAVSASTLNPAFGIQIVTNGDSIAADYSQFEAGTVATFPILTTTTTAIRATEISYVDNPPWFNQAQGTFSSSIILPGFGSTSIAGVTFINNDGQANKRYDAFIVNNGPTIQPSAQNVGSFYNIGQIPYTLNTVAGVGVSYSLGNVIGSVQGNTAPNGPQNVNPLPPGINLLTFFSNDKSGVTQPGWMRQLKYWNFAQSQAQLNTKTLFF